MNHEITMCSVRTFAFGDKSVPLWGLGDKAASLGTVPEVWGQLAPMQQTVETEYEVNNIQQLQIATVASSKSKKLLQCN